MRKTSLKTVKKLMVWINSEAEKYLKIYKEIDEVESPALEKIISENLDAIKEAKTLIEFIDIKQTLLIDFKMAILFFINLELSGCKNLSFHPIMARLRKYEEIYARFKEEGSDFHTLGELLDSIVEEENEEGLEKAKNMEKESKVNKDEILLKSRKEVKLKHKENSKVEENSKSATKSS